MLTGNLPFVLDNNRRHRKEMSKLRLLFEVLLALLKFLCVVVS